MLVYIKPLSIFPELHSDTIFGAIISAINDLYAEVVEEILLEFKENPPFILSSAFPYLCDGNKKIKFYPKIITANISTNKENKSNEPIFEEDMDNRKKFKKVRYIQEEIFFKLASGELKEIDIIKNLDKYNVNGDLLTNNDLIVKGKTSLRTIPNNSVNRISQESENIFYSEGYEFKDMGLFFFIKFRENKYEEIIKSAIKFLKDRGFGKDISVGKGNFDYEIEEYDLAKNEGNYFITLSRYIPNEEDLNKINEYSAYELGSKRAKASSGELRKQIRFFKEGSTFPQYNNHYGRIVESGKNSPAIEYGYAFPFTYNNCGV
ncbi:MAG: type III-A CRISPR-associated RAMP protein Csm4 [Methanobrevibacter sp.]|jgi:CRISPR-associated protein Csm4|nr:type III-A CRISPR-associated RAMP protein Csm4 [Candidatus Methanovirga meridionalis]